MVEKFVGLCNLYNYHKTVCINAITYVSNKVISIFGILKTVSQEKLSYLIKNVIWLCISIIFVLGVDAERFLI